MKRSFDLFDDRLKRYKNPIEVGVGERKVSRDGSVLYSKGFDGCTALAIYRDAISGLYHVWGFPDDLGEFLSCMDDGSGPFRAKLAGQPHAVKKVRGKLMNLGVRFRGRRKTDNYFDVIFEPDSKKLLLFE